MADSSDDRVYKRQLLFPSRTNGLASIFRTMYDAMRVLYEQFDVIAQLKDIIMFFSAVISSFLAHSASRAFHHYGTSVKSFHRSVF